jgi:DNA modification methylase
VEQCKNEIPVLKEIKSRSVKNDDNKPTHLMIEGDNYHALQVLNYTHKKKIDAIYIDPPYNTGAKDWKYNNDYVDGEDTYRHSKWLSFMSHRLEITKNLLSREGIICCTIDDYELPRLTILMEEIFGKENYLGTICIRNNPSGRSTLKGISVNHEYAIFFAKSSSSNVGRLPRNEKQIERYKKKDSKGYYEEVNFRKGGGLRKESPIMFYPIFISDKTWRIPEMYWDKDKKEWVLQENPKEKETIIYPIDDLGRDKRWKWGLDRVRAESDELFVRRINNKNHLFHKNRMAHETVLPNTWWDKKEYSATDHGTRLLKDIFGELKTFDYPKAVTAVKDCLRVLSSKKNAIFLDFFAGSGTTAHAVMELNKEDGGKRQSISVTNNEGGIAKEICHSRIKKVINGYSYQGKEEELIWQKKIGIRELKKGSDIYKKSEEIKEKTLEECDGCEVKRTMAKKDGILQLIKEKTIDGKKDGLGGSLKYYKTDFIKKKAEGKISDEDKIALSQQAGEMIAIRENTLEKEKETDWWQIFSADNQSTAIYFREDKSKLNDLVTEISQKDTPSALYVFSWGTNEYSNEFADYENIRIEDIPQPILEVYRKINQL